MKDCFGLHGHSAFGSVPNEEIGVGRKSATSVGLTTDPVYWLQAGKTVDISRCASESTDLLPPSALLRPRCGLQLPRPPALRLAYYRLPPVIVLPLWMLLIVVVFVWWLYCSSSRACASDIFLFVADILLSLYIKGINCLALYIVFLL